jgi:hypothetical protein
VFLKQVPSLNDFTIGVSEGNNNEFKSAQMKEDSLISSWVIRTKRILMPS